MGKNKKKHKGWQPQGQPLPLAPPVPVGNVGAETNAPTRQEGKDSQRDNPTNFSTRERLLVTVNVLTLACLIFQSWAMNRQLGQMERATGQTDKIITQGDANNRAWLGPSRIVISAPEIGKPITVEITLHNSGNFPALEVSNRCILRIGPIAGLNPPETALANIPFKKFGTTLPGGDAFVKIISPETMTAERILAIQSGTVVVHIMGEMTYGGGRFTHYFSHFDPGDGRFVSEETYNDAK